MASSQDTNKLGPNQPLESNLNALAKNPQAAIDAFGVEWAGRVAASAMERLARQGGGDTLLRQFLAEAKAAGVTHLNPARQEQEPVAMRYDFDGYGYKYIDSGSGSNWQTRHKGAEPLYAAPVVERQEPVAHSIVAGALFDFMGWLTSRRERLVLSSTDDAAPAADAIKDFARMRSLSMSGAQVQDWQENLTAPPAREWYGLTRQDINEAFNEGGGYDDFARAIEAKLREKNHG